VEISDRRSNRGPISYARQVPWALAVCGARPFNPWRNRRRNVTCLGGVAEIEWRLQERPPANEAWSGRRLAQRSTRCSLAGGRTKRTRVRHRWLAARERLARRGRSLEVPNR
jgi:hypothetical protein